MKRRYVVARVNHNKVAQSLTITKLCAEVGLIEHLNYVDANYKSPIVHQGLKRGVEGMQGAIDHINKVFKDSYDPEQIEAVTLKMHELMKKIVFLNVNELEELNNFANQIIER